MFLRLFPSLTLMGLVFFAQMSFGQGATVPFGGLKHDASQSIEITSDSLTVSQGNANAEFIGAVNAGQGTLKIRADRLLVEYEKAADDSLTGKIFQMSAFGNVTLSNGAEAAEAAEAVYKVKDGQVRMTGDVLLTQGGNAIAGEILNIDLNSGNAVFEGRVRTVLQPSAN